MGAQAPSLCARSDRAGHGSLPRARLVRANKLPPCRRHRGTHKACGRDVAKQRAAALAVLYYCNKITIQPHFWQQKGGLGV